MASLANCADKDKSRSQASTSSYKSVETWISYSDSLYTYDYQTVDFVRFVIVVRHLIERSIEISRHSLYYQ